jgi:hypothetical protein
MQKSPVAENGRARTPSGWLLMEELWLTRMGRPRDKLNARV